MPRLYRDQSSGGGRPAGQVGDQAGAGTDIGVECVEEVWETQLLDARRHKHVRTGPRSRLSLGRSGDPPQEQPAEQPGDERDARVRLGYIIEGSERPARADGRHRLRPSEPEDPFRVLAQELRPDVVVERHGG